LVIRDPLLWKRQIGMKSIFAALALTTALTLPSLAVARPITVTTTLNQYGGDGAYLAFYITDPQGKYAGTVWVAGGKSKYYEHLSSWYRATGGNPSGIDGITGASVGAGRTLEISLDLTAAVEDMRDSPNDVAIPLTSDGAGTPAHGRLYVASLAYSR
jgi:hypothetical protein